MNVTVIVCTYNRCRTLATALDSVAASAMHDSVAWEVLVVDNNSKDDTRGVVKQYSDKFPGRFRYIREERQGKSYALNTGIREAKGDILAFLDDDVTVEPAWLPNLTAPVLSGEWVGAGGRIRASEISGLPDWMVLEGPYGLGGVLCGLFDCGEVPRELQLDTAPNGSNMAYHRRIFEKYGLFRTDMGPSIDNTTPHPNEDTEFGRRLMLAGERLFYVPDAIIYHPVLQERLRKDYFLSWWFDYGRAVILEKRRRPPILGIPRKFFSISDLVVRYLLTRTLRWCLTLDKRRRFYNKCQVWSTAGAIVQTYRQPSEPPLRSGQMAQKPVKNITHG